MKRFKVFFPRAVFPLIQAVFFILITVTAFSSFTRETGLDEKRSKSVFQEVYSPEIPDQLFFAGEEVPLWNFDVYESLDRELIINSFFHSQTLRFLKLAPRYFEIIEPILKQDTVPDDFKYLALAESGFDPRALSPAGAAGIWQFMKPAAREYGLEMNDEIDERYHIEKATHAACRYLKESFARYGDWTTVAASYNAGRNGIDRQVERQKETHYYNLLLSEETTRYVFRILALKTIIESPEKYGFHVTPKEFYPSIPFQLVEVDSAITSFADFARIHKTNYKILKMLNPWLRETGMRNAGKKSYQIKIPVGKYRQYEQGELRN